MTLFKFRKKKHQEPKAPACACKCPCASSKAEKITSHRLNEATSAIYSIKVLGAGCKSCHEQYENAKKTVKEMELPVEVEYITDMQKVMEYGVMSMPVLVVNEKVVSQGKVLKAADIEKLLDNSAL